MYCHDLIHLRLIVPLPSIRYCVTTVALYAIVTPFFSAMNKQASVRQNAEMLSKMRYVTSAIVFQLTAVGGLAMMTQKSMKLSSHLKRLMSLLDVLDDLNAKCKEDSASAMLEGPTIKFDGVTVTTPTGNQLVTDLSFEVTPKQNLLITGPNGAGKSSIFRCLGGLWRIPAGSVTKPKSSGGAGSVLLLF